MFVEEHGTDVFVLVLGPMFQRKLQTIPKDKGQCVLMSNVGSL